MSERKYMPIIEFVDGGYLQEVNRQLLHPLGLALEIQRVASPGVIIKLDEEGLERLRGLLEYVEQCDAEGGRPSRAAAAMLGFLEQKAQRMEPGDSFLSGVWDYRDDPEGIVFTEDFPLAPKAAKVAQEWRRRQPAREKMLGDMVQSLDGLPEHVTPRSE